LVAFSTPEIDPQFLHENGDISIFIVIYIYIYIYICVCDIQVVGYFLVLFAGEPVVHIVATDVSMICSLMNLLFSPICMK
jgi:hypothetical protein